uniref:Uncharacterized protein n=1 Tax=Globodera rostochiensis TaxID=31243 RepID=A0A914IDM9_GLORO
MDALKKLDEQLSEKRADEDIVDRVNNSVTPSVLLSCAIIVFAKEYGPVSELMYCWSQAEFNSEWMEYVHDFCFVESTYYVPFNNTVPVLGQRNKGVDQLNYYQRRTFPTFSAKFLAPTTGRSSPLRQTLAVTSTSFCCPTQTIRSWRTKSDGKGKCFLSTSFSVFLGVNKLSNWGFEVLNSFMTHGSSWEHNGLFPRVMLCGLEDSPDGRTLFRLHCPMCAGGKLSERKIFLMLYFLFILMAIVSFISLLHWTWTFLFCTQKKFVNKLFELSLLQLYPDPEFDVDLMIRDGEHVDGPDESGAERAETEDGEESEKQQHGRAVVSNATTKTNLSDTQSGTSSNSSTANAEELALHSNDLLSAWRLTVARKTMRRDSPAGRTLFRLHCPMCAGGKLSERKDLPDALLFLMAVVSYSQSEQFVYALRQLETCQVRLLRAIQQHSAGVEKRRSASLLPVRICQSLALIGYIVTSSNLSAAGVEHTCHSIKTVPVLIQRKKVRIRQSVWSIGAVMDPNAARAHLALATRNIKRACLKIPADDIKLFTVSICQHFVGHDTFLTPDFTMSEYDNFVRQLDAMTARIANDDPEKINRAGNFLYSQSFLMGRFADIRALNQPSGSGSTSMGQHKKGTSRAIFVRDLNGQAPNIVKPMVLFFNGHRWYFDKTGMAISHSGVDTLRKWKKLKQELDANDTGLEAFLAENRAIMEKERMEAAQKAAAELAAAFAASTQLNYQSSAGYVPYPN